MVKKSLVTFVLATTLIGATGCANNNDTKNALDDNRVNRGVNVRNNTNNDLNVRNVRNNTHVGVRNVKDQNLRVSTRAGQSVENLKEVDLAHVIIRNNDAYVAVKLHNQTKNNQARNGGNNMGTTGINGSYTDRSNDITARGAGTGRNGNYPNTTGITGTGNTGNALNPGATGTDNTSNALNPGTTGTGTSGNIGIRGTNDGTTGTRDSGMNGNTNVVDTDANFRKASSGLDKKIKKQVHAVDKKVDRVYVSYDNDFFNQMTDYSNDLQSGRNRDGLWNDFTDTVGRIFR